MSEQHDERLARIRARLAAATPGPWSVRPDWPEGRPCSTALLSECRLSFAAPIGTRDAVFIAFAREDVPWLIGEVERLAAQRDLAEAKLERVERTIRSIKIQLEEEILNAGRR